MVKILTSFSHKGGVGKTTLVYNLACAIAEKGKQVLLVDADSQMNLTADVFGFSDKIEYDLSAESDWRANYGKYLSIGDIVTGIREMARDPLSASNMPSFREKPLFSRPEALPGIALLAGNVELSTLEAGLALSALVRDDFRANLPGLIEREIRLLGKDLDYILIDTSPSASSLINGICVMMSDYFFCPVTPSFACLQAMNGLGMIVEQWVDLLLPFAKQGDSARLSFRPKFAGMVINVAKKARGSFAKHSEEWCTMVNSGARRGIELLLARNLAITEQKFCSVFKGKPPYIMGMSPHFTGTIRDASEKKGLPVYALKETDFRNCKKTFDMYVDNLREIARDILELDA